MVATHEPEAYVPDDVAVYEAAAMRMRASWERKPRSARDEATAITPRPSFATGEPTRAVGGRAVPAPHLLPTRFMGAARPRTNGSVDAQSATAKAALRGPNRWLQLGVAAGITMALTAGVVALLQPKAAPWADNTQSAASAPAITLGALAASTAPMAGPAQSAPSVPLPAVKSLASPELEPRTAAKRRAEPVRIARPTRPSAPAPRPARARPTVARTRPSKKPAPQQAAPAPQMPSWTSVGSRTLGTRAN